MSGNLLFLIFCNLLPDGLVPFARIQDSIERIKKQAMRLSLVFMPLKISFEVGSQIVQFLYLFFDPLGDVLLEDFVGVEILPWDW